MFFSRKQKGGPLQDAHTEEPPTNSRESPSGNKNVDNDKTEDPTHLRDRTPVAQQPAMTLGGSSHNPSDINTSVSVEHKEGIGGDAATVGQEAESPPDIDEGKATTKHRLQHATVAEPIHGVHNNNNNNNKNNNNVGLLPGAVAVAGCPNQEVPVDLPEQEEVLRANDDLEIAQAYTVSEPTVIEAHEVVDSSNDGKEEAQKFETRACLELHSRKIWVAIIVLLVGVLVIGLAVGLTSNNSPTHLNDAVSEDSADLTAAPTSMPTPITELLALIKSRSPSTTFDNATSPQSLALNWMETDPYSQFSLEGNDDRLIQRFALAVFWYSTGGPTTWKYGDGWMEPTNVCTWMGVGVCSSASSGIARNLYLGSSGLSGTIPNEIGLLEAMTSVKFGNNLLTGTLPTELGQMTRLTQLQLNDNQITGSIPSEFGHLTSMSVLHLWSNKLFGKIPPSLCGASNHIRIDCAEVDCSCCKAEWPGGDSC